MIKRFFLLIAFFYFFSFSLLSAITDQSPDSLLAGIYLEHAVVQFDSGNFAKAFSLADISLAFIDTSSDALLVRGVSSRKSEIKNSSMADLSMAIIRDNWEYFNETTARVYLSEILYFAGDIESAYINLLPFSNNLANNSFYTEIFIRMALSLGKIDEAVRTADNLLVVDPYDNYSQLIMALYDSEWRMRAEKVLIEGDPANYFSKDVVQIVIKSTVEGNSLIDLYKDRWGEDRFYKIYTICNKKEMLEEVLDELYPENSVVNHKELTWIYSLVEDESIKLLIREQLGSIKLTIIYDIDNDGFNDTEALFEIGHLVALNFDSDQDNNYDHFVELEESPVSLIIKEKEKTLSFSYKSYPNLINVTVSDEKSLTEYQLIPYALTLDIIRFPLDLINEIPYILDNISFPTGDILTVSSTQRSISNFDTSLESNYVWVGSDKSIENVFDYDGIQVVERHFRSSVLITVFKDLDSDGVFDTTYDYKDGLLQSVSFDANNNGISEYIENYENHLVRSWDFNEDGLWDTRERNENGTIYRELSSELNGEFGTSIEIRGDMN